MITASASLTESALIDRLHGGLVTHPESSPDGRPGVPSIPGFLDELSAPGGHAVHPLLEGGESFEDVFGHEKTVTGVAISGQVCNHGYMHETTQTIDRYTRQNYLALAEFEARGQDAMHGVDGRTLHAFARRGLVWFDRDMTGGLTPAGKQVLDEMEAN